MWHGYSARTSCSLALPVVPPCLQSVPYVATVDAATQRVGVLRLEGDAWMRLGDEGPFFAPPDKSTCMPTCNPFGPEPAIAIGANDVPYVAYPVNDTAIGAVVIRYSAGSWSSLGQPGALVNGIASGALQVRSNCASPASAAHPSPSACRPYSLLLCRCGWRLGRQASRLLPSTSTPGAQVALLSRCANTMWTAPAGRRWAQRLS